MKSAKTKIPFTRALGKWQTLSSAQVIARKWLITIILTVVSVVALYPLLFTILNSFKSNNDYARNPLGLPIDITFNNYVETFRRMDVPRLFINSAVVTLGGLFLTTFSALLMAYVVTKMNFPGKGIIFLFVISMLVIPSQAIIYPLYDTIRRLGVGSSYLGLILALAAFGLPLGTYQLATCFRAIPHELFEAARVDGAGHMRILFSVMLPIATPAVAAVSILNFVWMWNDLLLPLVIMGGSEKKTLMVGISLLSGEYDISIPLISAGLITALLPVLLVYLMFQRKILSGAIAGAVK
jgi:ABC-type glycerol-3-phosphate transport system permease component